MKTCVRIVAAAVAALGGRPRPTAGATCTCDILSRLATTISSGAIDRNTDLRNYLCRLADGPISHVSLHDAHDYFYDSAQPLIAGDNARRQVRRFITSMAILTLFFGSLFFPPAVSAQNSLTKLSTPADKFMMAPGGVDLNTGAYIMNEPDLVIGGGEASDGLSLVRKQMAPDAGHLNPFGNFSHNWDISLNLQRINLATGNIPGTDFRAFVYVDGRTQTFEAHPNSGFRLVSTAGYAALTFTGNRENGTAVYTYRSEDGTEVTFQSPRVEVCSNLWACSYVSELVHPDGTRLTFDYVSESAASGIVSRLWRVVSSRGYALVLEGSAGTVTKACAINLAYVALPESAACPSGAQATVSYTYSNGRLTGITDPLGGLSQITYAATGTNTFDMGFIKPGRTTPWLVNSVMQYADQTNVFAGVISQKFANGQKYTYSSGYTDAQNNLWALEYGEYQAPGNEACPFPPCALPDIDQPTFTQVTPGPIKITDPLQRVTEFNYCEPRITVGCSVYLLQWFKDPEGIKTVYTYGNTRNIMEVHRITPDNVDTLVVKRAFDCTSPKCQAKPTSQTDARLNTTKYEYSTDHGGLVKETSPAVNGVTAQTRYTYQQRYAWVVAGGSYAQAATPVWLLAEESFCRAGNPAASGIGCETPGDEVLTSYDYGLGSGPNNLLLRATVVRAGGKSMRTCYRYDALGRKISETGPSETLTECP